MFSLRALAITATEVPNILWNNGNPFPVEWENTLMDCFYSEITAEGTADYSNEDTSRNYCEWRGVVCTAGKVGRVIYDQQDYGNFDIHSLPPTVTRISIEHCLQHYMLHTRRLPRASQFCYLGNNQLFGSVELRTLPENLVTLRLSDNRLNGPIDLTNLPQKFAYLWLHRNAIEQSVVFFGRLPPNITAIRLATSGKRDNQIGELRALYPESLDRARQVFRPPVQIKFYSNEAIQ
ncbi:leucine-rich repeat [Perkinsela sp. CCAP 1560/4]|nr:leucine-rich repeat [Perkinsela sp. CCAP 1560/4]|eukprot:KNH05113.1 leucine-rich repeat [Perkinsela sp. CCAP 1560/4]